MNGRGQSSCAHSGLANKLTIVRKETVETFRTTQQRVRNTYICVEKDVYDKKHPGNREKDKLVLKPFFRGGEWVDCVMVPKQEQGHFEVDVEDLSLIHI